MSKPDIEIVRRIYSEGRAKDLHALITGESPFSLPLELGDNYPLPGVDRNFEDHEGHICRMAEEHLWFVAEFGSDVFKASKDGKYYSSYPDYFYKWLEIGCKRVHQEEIDAYLKNCPLKPLA